MIRLNRVVVNYTDDGKALQVKASGTDGLSGLKAALDDDGVYFGFLRLISGDTESKRAKFVFMTYSGANVSVLKRARVSVHKADIKRIFKDFAIEAAYDSLDDVNEAELEARVRKAGGADYSGAVA